MWIGLAVGYVKGYFVSWFLILTSVLVPVVIAGRAHSRYLDRLQADPERQLMSGIRFENPFQCPIAHAARPSRLAFGGFSPSSGKANQVLGIEHKCPSNVPVLFAGAPPEASETYN